MKLKLFHIIKLIIRDYLLIIEFEDNLTKLYESHLGAEAEIPENTTDVFEWDGKNMRFSAGKIMINY